MATQSHVRNLLFKHYEQYDIFHHCQHNAKILLLEKNHKRCRKQ